MRLGALPRLIPAVLLAAWPHASALNAADAPQATLDGLVQHALTLTTQSVQAASQSTVHITYLTSHGPEDADFSGVSLWDLLQQAGLGAGLADRKTRAAHYLVLSGRDGYQIIIALGEIDPDFEGKTVLIATTRNGKPLPAHDGLRLVVPGDHHGGRAVYDVAHIDVK